MKEDTRVGPELTIGVDLGDRYSHLCVVDEHGEVNEEGRIATTARAMRKRFEGMARCRVVIEVGSHSPWVQRLLEELGHEVITAHTQAVRLIYGGTNKNDRLDAERLARLGRVDPKLLHPIQHRGATAQADRAVVRSRHVLVGCRTKLINHARGMVKSMGGRLPSCSAESFHKRVGMELPDELKPALLPVLETIASLTQEIRRYDQRIEALASKRYPDRGSTVRGLWSPIWTPGFLALQKTPPVSPLAGDDVECAGKSFAAPGSAPDPGRWPEARKSR